jgi:hypothetical protein
MGNIAGECCTRYERNVASNVRAVIPCTVRAIPVSVLASQGTAISI